ncbi:hypothetical protein SARC_13136, partial [Sphaeroforma arctica JP610]
MDRGRSGGLGGASTAQSNVGYSVHPAASSMLETAERLAKAYAREPEKVKCMLQNLQTYGVWVIIAHFLFKLMDRQAAESAANSTAGLFDLAGMTDSGSSDQALGVRLGKLVDAVK